MVFWTICRKILWTRRRIMSTIARKIQWFFKFLFLAKRNKSTEEMRDPSASPRGYVPLLLQRQYDNRRREVVEDKKQAQKQCVQFRMPNFRVECSFWVGHVFLNETGLHVVMSQFYIIAFLAAPEHLLRIEAPIMLLHRFLSQKSQNALAFSLTIFQPPRIYTMLRKSVRYCRPI